MQWASGFGFGMVLSCEGGNGAIDVSDIDIRVQTLIYIRALALAPKPRLETVRDEASMCFESLSEMQPKDPEHPTAKTRVLFPMTLNPKSLNPKPRMGVLHR